LDLQLIPAYSTSLESKLGFAVENTRASRFSRATPFFLLTP
jgi:hypothetical protein